MPPREELIAKYDSGRSSNSIAEDYQVVGRTVRGWLNRYEIPVRKRGRLPRPMPPREELSAKCEVMSLRQMSEDYNIDRKSLENG